MQAKWGLAAKSDNAGNARVMNQ
ncbi:MAG: hypothetical protein V7646_6449, partial [Pseudonocardia sp.]